MKYPELIEFNSMLDCCIKVCDNCIIGAKCKLKNPIKASYIPTKNIYCVSYESTKYTKVIDHKWI